MAAKLFFATRAIETPICCRGEPFGMQTVAHLPPHQKGKSKPKKAVCINAGNKDERGKHHRKIPVVDAAGGTATVLHKPRLEGAEKKNTDHVANRVSQGEQNQNPLIEDAKKVQSTDYGVQRKPKGGDKRGYFP